MYTYNKYRLHLHYIPFRRYIDTQLKLRSSGGMTSWSFSVGRGGWRPQRVRTPIVWISPVDIMI